MAAQKSLNEDYKSDGKWKEIWRRFKKNKGAVIGLVLLVVLTVILVGAPLFISYDKAITQNMDLMLAKPSVGNLFGNDGYGRDIFARILRWTCFHCYCDSCDDFFMPVWQPSRCSRWLFWRQGRQHYHAVPGYFYVGS